MKKIIIELKEGKKKPLQVSVGQNFIILVGSPPYTVDEKYLPFLCDFFDIKQDGQPEKKEEKEKEKGGKK